MRSIRMLGLALVASVAVAGCGDDDDDPFGPGNMGTFTGEVTGHVTEDLSGNAVFSVYDDGTDETFVLTLTSGTLANVNVLLTLSRAGARPGNNTYNIGTTAGTFSGLISFDETNDTYVFDGGTVTITSSGTGGVNGTLNLTATDGTNDIAITGTFASECLEDEEENLTCG